MHKVKENYKSRTCTFENIIILNKVCHYILGRNKAARDIKEIPDHSGGAGCCGHCCCGRCSAGAFLHPHQHYGECHHGEKWGVGGGLGC